MNYFVERCSIKSANENIIDNMYKPKKKKYTGQMDKLQDAGGVKNVQEKLNITEECI